jgi:hypothetical protein
MGQRAVIKLCVKLKKTPTEKFEMLKNTYNRECLFSTSVSEWFKRFKEGRESLQGKW